MDYQLPSNVHAIQPLKQNTFSVGGGGTLTVSASSTLKGSSTLLESTLLESVDRYLPLLEAAIALCGQKRQDIRQKEQIT